MIFSYQKSLRVFPGILVLSTIADYSNRFGHLQSSELTAGVFFEYSCAVTPQVRQTGNRLSGLAGTAYASLLT